MKIRDLVRQWESSAATPLTEKAYEVKLSLDDAAKIRALREIYPGRDEEDLIRELLAAALDELEGVFPYVEGRRVIAHDEYGDDVYEDAGLTPRFRELTRRFRDELGDGAAVGAGEHG